jgi:hypothetical protein
MVVVPIGADEHAGLLLVIAIGGERHPVGIDRGGMGLHEKDLERIRFDESC